MLFYMKTRVVNKHCCVKISGVCLMELQLRNVVQVLQIWIAGVGLRCEG